MKRISQSLKTGPNAAYQLKSSFSEKRTTLMISTKIKKRASIKHYAKKFYLVPTSFFI